MARFLPKVVATLITQSPDATRIRDGLTQAIQPTLDFLNTFFAPKSDGSLQVLQKVTITGDTVINGNLTVSGSSSASSMTAATPVATNPNPTFTSVTTQTLTVSGNSTLAGLSATSSSISGNESVGGVLSVTKDASVGGGLTVTGVANLNGTTTVNAALIVNKGSTIAGGETVTGGLTTDTLTVSNTLKVTKAATLSGGLTVTGGTTTDTLSVTGAASLASLSTSGNATVGGTLAVTGAATLSDALSVAKTTTLKAGVAVTGGTTTDTLSASGNASVGGTLTVSGTSSFNAVSSGQLTASSIQDLGTLSVAKAATLQSGVTVTGTTTTDVLTVNGSSNLAAVSATGNVSVGGTLGVTGNTTLGANATVTGTTTLNNTLSVNATAMFFNPANGYTAIVPSGAAGNVAFYVANLGNTARVFQVDNQGNGTFAGTLSFNALSSTNGYPAPINAGGYYNTTATAATYAQTYNTVANVSTGLAQAASLNAPWSMRFLRAGSVIGYSFVQSGTVTGQNVLQYYKGATSLVSLNVGAGAGTFGASHTKGTYAYAAGDVLSVRVGNATAGNSQIWVVIFTEETG